MVGYRKGSEGEGLERLIRYDSAWYACCKDDSARYYCKYLDEWGAITKVVSLYFRAFRRLYNDLRAIAGYTGKDVSKVFRIEVMSFQRVVRVTINLLDFGSDVEEIIAYYSVAKSPLRPYRVSRVLKKLSPPDREGYRFTGKLHRFRVFIGKTTRRDDERVGSYYMLKDAGVIIFSKLSQFLEYVKKHYVKRLQGILSRYQGRFRPYGRFAIAVYILQVVAEVMNGKLSDDVKVFEGALDVVRVVR